MPLYTRIYYKEAIVIIAIWEATVSGWEIRELLFVDVNYSGAFEIVKSIE